MIGLLLTITNITGGILLGLTTLDKYDGDSNIFNKVAVALAPFQTIIGGALVVLPLLHFGLSGLLSILGGILLLMPVFDKVPSLEPTLNQLSSRLMPFKAIIGVALLILGVMGLLR